MSVTSILTPKIRPYTRNITTRKEVKGLIAYWFAQNEVAGDGSGGNYVLTGNIYSLGDMFGGRCLWNVEYITSYIAGLSNPLLLLEIATGINSANNISIVLRQQFTLSAWYSHLHSHIKTMPFNFSQEAGLSCGFTITCYPNTSGKTFNAGLGGCIWDEEYYFQP